MHFSFSTFSKVFLEEFPFVKFEGVLVGFLWGDHSWVPCDLFLGDLEPSNPLNRLGFDDFWRNPSLGVLGVCLAIPHNSVGLGTWSTSYGLPMRYSFYPQSFIWIHWANWEIGWVEVEGWPAGTVPGQSGLTAPGRRCNCPWSSLSFWGDLLGACLPWSEKARVKFSSSFDSVFPSFRPFLWACPRRSNRPCTPVKLPLAQV